MKRFYAALARLFATLMVLSCLFLLFIHAQGLSRTATSSIETGYDKDGNEVVTTKNTRFIFRTLDRDYSYQRTLVLQETLTRREVVHEDGDQATVSVQAWMGKDIDPTTPAWSFQQTGDAGGIFDEDTFYRVTEYSEADLAPTYTFYDLISGRKVYLSTSGQLFDIIVPNTGSRFMRYVAYHGRESIDPPAECAKDRSIVGVLQYGSEDQVQERVLVRIAHPKNSDGYTTLATIAGRYPLETKPKFAPPTNELWLWHSDEIASRKAISHFTLHVTFPQGRAFIDLPVENDRIDWKHVTHSPDIALQETTP